MAGILYGAGVGPGDPELMTLKTVRLIREADYIALPSEEPRETMAYRIAAAAVPELAQKKLIALHMPMTRDPEEMKRRHREGAACLEEYLQAGKDVVFLTIGDPAIYSTFAYLQRIVEQDGFQTRYVSGVPSFCAAAARLNRPLAVWEEPLHIFPAVHQAEMVLPETGTCILMKAGKRLRQIRELLKKAGRNAAMVENCGTDQEKIYKRAEDMPDEAGYYSLVITGKDLL